MTTPHFVAYGHGRGIGDAFIVAERTGVIPPERRGFSIFPRPRQIESSTLVAKVVLCHEFVTGTFDVGRPREARSAWDWMHARFDRTDMFGLLDCFGHEAGPSVALHLGKSELRRARLYDATVSDRHGVYVVFGKTVHAPG